MNYEYLEVGRAEELAGQERILYRFLEMLPGLLTWFTLIGTFLFSWLFPVAIALFIIAFDVYWVIKSFYLSIHLRVNWNKMRHNLNLDWSERLKSFKYNHLLQMVVLPFYKEEFETIAASLESLIDALWPVKDKMIVVLACEERGGERAEEIAQRASQKYKDKFAHFLVTKHPKDIPGELAGKGSNVVYAAEEARKKILDKYRIKYEDVIISVFDIDTRVYPQFFLCLTWNFLTCEKPFRSSFQPVPVYNNNIWGAPAFSRVVATSGTFWQMIEQERPEQLVTFSSHSMSFKSLYEIGYGQKNIVSEDSRIFWKSFLYFNGDYKVIPLSYPLSMDANLAENFWQTAKNVYQQQRRWTWGTSENFVYLLFGFLKNKKISWRKKLQHFFVQLEGNWSVATNPLIIFFLGWLPLALGGEDFNKTLLSYNLPHLTSNIMSLAMIGLVLLAIISTALLPPRPPSKSKHQYLMMILQWILVPLTIPVFGSLPAIDAQTRLMLGKYLGFWVTPKPKNE